MIYVTTQKSVNDALPVLAGAVLNRGEEVGSRNGRCTELTHVSVQLTEPWRREILLPSRRASLPAQIAESMWILAGRSDIAWLSHYLPRAADFSDDGEVWRGGYGPRIRHWNERNNAFGGIDQLDHVVKLLRQDPMTRRAVINIYDPSVDTAPGKDIPCNNWLHFLNRSGQLDLAVTIRSNDLIWGWSGINAFEWSVLLEVVAGLVGVQVGTLTFHISSLHIYEKHWQRARRITEDMPRLGAPSSRFSTEDADDAFEPADTEWLDGLIKRWFEIEARIRDGQGYPEEIELAISRFPEPMMRSWLKVLQWWWGPYGAEHAPDIIGSNALADAAVLSPGKPNGPPAPAELAAVADTRLCDPDNSRFAETNPVANTNAFKIYVADLHRTKDAAYGDSWRRRGEMLGIMANIARKVDRLGQTDDHETAADTSIDLWVYLLKYRLWLAENVGGTPFPPNVPVDFDVVDGPADSCQSNGPWFGSHAAQVTALIGNAQIGVCSSNEHESLITALRQQFDQLESDVTDHYDGRWRHVEAMADNAALLARSQWAAQQWRAGNATRTWNPEAGA